VFEPILLAVFSSLAALAGVALAVLMPRRKSLGCLGIGFSCGVMVVLAAASAFPEASSLIGLVPALAATAAGFAIVWFLDSRVPHTHFFCELCGNREARAGVLVAAGLAIHDFPEGFALAASFAANSAVGIAVAVGLVLHKIPEGFALGAPLALSRQKGLLWRIASFSSLVEPLGAVAGVALFALVPALNPFMLAFAAGAMLFVALDELLPLAVKYGGAFEALLGFLAGALSYWMLSSWLVTALGG